MKLFICFLALISSTAYAAIPQGPVMVGGEESLDACGGYGIVTVTTVLYTQNKESGYTEFHKIDAAQGVSFCDYQKTYDDQEFIGVVFSEDENVSCGVSSPIERRQPYRGKCKSGWVDQKYLELIAG